jgi:hypothetical protein
VGSVSVCVQGRGRILNRAQNSALESTPHPRLRRGLSRNKAGEAHNQWRGTRHPNLTLTFILSLTGRGEEQARSGRAEPCTQYSDAAHRGGD